MTIPKGFSALLLNQTPTGIAAEFTTLTEDALPPGEVLIRVQYSALNYKDGLAICRGAPVVRKFPIVPGVEFAGTVESSTSDRFHPGELVMVNGWGVGENRWGGYAELARVPADFIQPLPTGLTPAKAMAFGTAGYTAMLCLMALERGGIVPQSGPVLVTGASGGVGGMAISLLAANGYTVAASTGRMTEADYLKSLGTTEIIDRTTLSAAGKPLQPERWAGAIDTVGSHTLANVCAQIRYGGAVAACGLAGGMDFPATVAPFILRGVTLYGIDAVRSPMGLREQVWARLVAQVDQKRLQNISAEIPLAQVVGAAHDILAGKIRGRRVVKITDGASSP